MRSILDYIKVFKNIETYKKPRSTALGPRNMDENIQLAATGIPSSDQAEFSKAWKEYNKSYRFSGPKGIKHRLSPSQFFQIWTRENIADGGRAGYNDGQLVTPNVDGSRPGYGENRKYKKIDTGYWSDVKGAPQKYDRKKIFKDINLEKYTKYIEDEFKSGDMSKTKVYKTWLNDKYGMKKGNYIYSETYKEFGDNFVRGTVNLYRNKKNELLRNLVDKANLSEKWGVEKQDIMKRIFPGGRFRSSELDPWLDKKYLDTLHGKQDKVKMVFNDIIEKDEILGPSKKYKRIGQKGNIISDMVMERTGLTDIKTVRAGISETNWYKQNEDLYRYMTHRGGRGEIKGLSFSEAIKFADEKRGSLEIKNLMGKAVKYQTPENHIIQFSARHVQRHFRDGTWDDSQIKFYKNGKPMTEADWAKLPTTDRGNKILDWNKVSFKYGNKVFHKGNLRTEGPKSGLFDEVYKLNKYFRKSVTNPKNVKGEKIPLKKLLNIMGDKLVLGHDDAKGGVKAKPFSNLKIQSQSVNDSLFKAYNHIKNKDLRKQVVKEIWGDLSGKHGQTYTDLFVEGAEKEAKNFLKNINKVELSPYRQAAKNIIEAPKGDWMKWSSRKQAELFKVAGVSSKDFNALNNAKPNEKISMLKKMGFKCRLVGGAGESVDCYMKDVGETNKLAKQGNKQAIKKLGNAFDIGKELPKVGKLFRQGLQIGLAGPAKLLQWSGLGTWGGLLLEGAVEGGIYKYYKDYKGLTHEQSLAETFTPGLMAGRPEGVPWYGGSEALQEKELYEVKDEAGNVVGTKQNVKDFIDTQRNMDQIGIEYDKLEIQKNLADEELGWRSQYEDTDYAHPRLDPKVGIENKQKALENEYLKLEQLNKPDALTGNYNAWLAAKEKQDTEQGLRVAEKRKKTLGAVDIPWDILNPNEMQRDYKLKKYEDAKNRWLKEQDIKRNRQMREKFPGYSDKQIDEILAYYETSQPEVGMSYGELEKMFDIGDKQAYFADNFRTEKAGGGMVGIRKPHAIPPERQGLRSIMINVNDD